MNDMYYEISIKPHFYFLAHEITHGFDNTGILFDSHGNLNLEYDPSTMIAFNDASNCIHQQYSAYPK